MPSALYEQMRELAGWLAEVGVGLLIVSVIMLLWPKPTHAQKRAAYERSRRDWRKKHPTIETKGPNNG